MEGKKRPTFDKKWWENISDYLNEHPEEGFATDEVKQFIKYAVNKHINSEDESISMDEFKKIVEDVTSE